MSIFDGLCDVYGIMKRVTSGAGTANHSMGTPPVFSEVRVARS